MANPEHLSKLKQGVEVWSEWRKEYQSSPPINKKVDLTGAPLKGMNLTEYDLIGVNLAGADMTEVMLTRAVLNDVDLFGAILIEADLGGTDIRQVNLGNVDLTGGYLGGSTLVMVSLHGANLTRACFREAFLTDVDLSRADLTGAELSWATLRGTNLHSANFNKVCLSHTIFAFADLSTVNGLDSCTHTGPSSLDTHTLLFSQKLPEVFLRGCGLPDTFINYLSALFQVLPIQFYSCFISHSTKDHLFAEWLFNDLQGNGVRTWYPPEEMKGGEKLYDQIDSAIRLHDKLLLVLSEHSLKSEWVLTEIRRCRKSEKREGKRKLFPIRLVDMKTIQDWECFDADSGKDLAVEVREFFIPDFSNWKDHDSYTQAFDRLLRDLKEIAEEGKPLS